MSKTPSQTIINASDDPGLLYLAPKVNNTVLRASVETDIGNITTRFVPVSQQIVNLFNDNTTVNVTNEVSGSSGELQFNVGGHFSSDSDLRYDSQTDTLSIKNLILSGNITFGDSSIQSSALSGGGSGFSGSYNDLTNKPTLFDGNYNSLTNKPTIPSISGLATETYVNNAVSGISIPTDVSDLTDNNNLLGQGGGSSYDQSLNTTDSPTFNNLALNGELQLPNYVKQTTNQSVVCNANVDTVVYTGSDQWQHSFKLLFKVEGVETEGQSWDTQTCEMTVAKSYRSDLVVGSVYGLVYTSTNPLATFTARWNSSLSRVEILCRPTSTTFGVEVRSFVTEITTSD
jgi:hypothetical protein